jgi:hypothetical protein
MGACFLYHPISFDLIIVHVFISIRSRHPPFLFTRGGRSLESELVAFNSCIYSRGMTSVLRPTVRLTSPTAAANPFTQTKHRPSTLRATEKQTLQSAKKTSALFPPNFRTSFRCQSHMHSMQLRCISYFVRNTYFPVKWAITNRS